MTDKTPAVLRGHSAVGNLAAMTGVPIIPSPYVPRGDLVTMEGRIYYHRHLSVTGKTRRGHGRPRNAPRRWKVEQRFVDYGLLDRIKEAASAPPAR